MNKRFLLIPIVALWLAIGCLAEAAEAPARKWDSLLDVTYKFSWYPRQDLQKLLDQKAAEYGQTLEEYRAVLHKEITGGRAPADRINPADFVTGLPWRDYYHLSMAEFSLFLVTDREQHLRNAQSAMSFLAQKDEQPEIEFWNYMYRAHLVCLAKDRSAFITEMYRLWQNVILRFELEARYFPSESAQAGFVKSLPYLYENAAHLVIRKAILEQEIPELYPLNAMIMDMRPKLTVENGYKTMVDQLVERMQGTSSDNKNINYAVALLEATAKRYDFEDEKDESLLGSKYNLVRKYYQLGYDWADTEQGRTAIMTQYMGFMNYVIRRFSDRRDMLVSNQYFNNIPTMASGQMDKAIQLFDSLAAPAIQKKNGETAGFGNRKDYHQAMHQLLDSTAKLAIVLSDFYKAERKPGNPEIFAAARPLEQYTNLFARYARVNPEVLPDNAYFLAAYTAKELGGLYRERARFSTDSRADAIAFAYQLQAAEIFPLDLPGILQMAFECSLNGQVRDYFQHVSPLSARLRVSNGAATWSSPNPTSFDPMITMVPTVVPKVIDNAFLILGHFPPEETSEDILFSKAVAMAGILKTERNAPTQEKTDELLTAIGKGNFTSASGTATTSGQGTYPFFELKSQLFGAPDHPLHDFIRTLYYEIPYENHHYVALQQKLR